MKTFMDTNPDWPRLLLLSDVRGGGPSGRSHQQLREAGGKGSQRRRWRRTRNTSRMKTKRLDDAMHENGKPAIGPDCEPHQRLLSGERRGHTTTSLKRTSIDARKRTATHDLECKGNAGADGEGAVRTTEKTSQDSQNQHQ